MRIINLNVVTFHMSFSHEHYFSNKSLTVDNRKFSAGVVISYKVSFYRIIIESIVIS